MDPHFFPRPSRFRGWVSRFFSRWVMLAGLLTGTLVSSVTAQTAPRLVSVSPADGAVDANVTNSLVYVFDQEMDVTVPIFASAGIGNLELLPANTLVLGTWGPDAKTLTLDPVFALPLNVTVSWTLNPAGSFLPIKSKAGTALATVSGSFTTGVGAPGLGSVSPVDNAVVVSPDVTVVFRFNQVMKKETNLGGNPPAVPGAVSWIGIGVDPAKFTYAWSVDGRQLSCEYAGNLPTNTIVGWALNPAGAAVILESATGKPLPTATYSGSFTTAAGVPCDQSPTPLSWGSYGITKRSTFAQETPADPEPVTDVAPFIFSTVVQSPSFGPAVTNGSLTLPDGTRSPLTNTFFLQAYWTFDTEAELDAGFPAGTYTLRFNQTGEPERVIPMNLPATAPPVPRIVNFTDAQQVNAGTDFTLQWTPFSGASADDFISIYISDGEGHVVFQAPDFCIPRPLPVTATSILIPANTLRTNQTYHAEILFGQMFYFSTNTVSNMSGYGNTIRATQFPMATSGGAIPGPASLGGPRILPNGHPAFELTGAPLATYGIQRAEGLDDLTWSEIGTVTLNASGQGTFEDSGAGTAFPRFYRAVPK